MVEPSSQLYNCDKQDIFLVDSDLVVVNADDKEEKISTSAIKNNYFDILKNQNKF